MANFKAKWKKMTGYARAFCILALIFLLFGLGTLGNVRTTGDSYELKKGSSVVFKLTKTETQKNIGGVYLNVGAIYNETGAQAVVRVRRSSSGTSWMSSGFGEKRIENMYFDPDLEANKNVKEENVLKDVAFNWVSLFDLDGLTYSLTSYPYYELTAQTCNLVVNEIVFLADDGTVIPAAVDKDKSGTIDEKAASAMLDCQQVPNLSQSSFFRYGKEEAYTLFSIGEIGAWSTYGQGNVYHADTVYNALGTDILGLGVAIFGMSPFGLRFFAFLASFGILTVGYLFAKKLFRKDSAGFVFAILYILSGAGFALGHFGTPLTLGIFFVLASLYEAYKFYMDGIRRPKVRDALPLLKSGIFGALAICINGAACIPVIGSVALYAVGMVRQHTAKKYHLMKCEGDEEAAAEVKAEYAYKNQIATLLFFPSLIVGALFFSLLAIIPVYYVYVKAFDVVSAPKLSLFALLWKGFEGGFVGLNAVGGVQSGFSLGYRLFSGSGDMYAVTLATVNPIAILAGAAGLVYSIVRLVMTLVKREKGKEVRAAVRPVCTCLAGLALALLSCLVKTNLPFVFLAYLFGFLFAAGKFPEGKKYTKAILIPCLVVLSLVFVFAVPYIFSVPMPSGWMDRLF